MRDWMMGFVAIAAAVAAALGYRRGSKLLPRSAVRTFVWLGLMVGIVLLLQTVAPETIRGFESTMRRLYANGNRFGGFLLLMAPIVLALLAAELLVRALDAGGDHGGSRGGRPRRSRGTRRS